MSDKDPENQPLTREDALAAGHKILDKEGHVQGPLPGFDPNPFDPHKQFVIAEHQDRLEKFQKGKLTLDELTQLNSQEKLDIESTSERDPLTGLKNRRRFMEDLRTAISVANTDGLEVYFGLIDLDNFKQKNDTLGHQVGDKILITLARFLEKKFTRGTDSVGRLGGEEFGILIIRPKKDLQASSADPQRKQSPEEYADEIRMEISDNLQKKLGLNQTASIGLSKLSDVPNPKSSQVLTELFENADRALYAAKNAGRNQVMVYNPNLPVKPTKK